MTISSEIALQVARDRSDLRECIGSSYVKRKFIKQKFIKNIGATKKKVFFP